MVKNELEQKLEEGVITQEEFDHIQNNRNSTTRSVIKNIFSFIATIFAIISILAGTCVLNLSIVNAFKSDVLILILSIVWVLFPFILFKHSSHKSNDTGMKWAAYTWLITAFFIACILFGN